MARKRVRGRFLPLPSFRRGDSDVQIGFLFSITKKNYGSEVYKELPKDWLAGLNINKKVASPTYDVNVNKYKAKCGGSLEMWETSGWIVEQDPYG